MINLLPPERKVAGHFYSRIYALSTVYLVVIVLLGLGAAGLATYNLTTGTTINEKQQTATELIAERNAHKKETVTAAFIEDRMKLASKYQDGQDWPNLLDQFDATVPTDVQLTSVKLASDASKAVNFSVAGTTTDRRSIILFRQKIAGNPTFGSATLQNITDTKVGDKKAFAFTIQFSLNPAAPKGGQAQ